MRGVIISAMLFPPRGPMRLLSTVLAALVLVGLTGCSDDGEDSAGAAPADLSEERATLAAIVSQPDGREGDEVTVAGEVVRSEERAFVLEAEGERLLIVPQFAPDQPYEVGTVVRAQGTVEPIPAGDDREIVGEERLFDEFEGEPTLAATEISVLD